MRTETFRDKLARQIALEDESRALGASRYRARRPLPWRTEPSSADEEGELPPGRALMRLAVQPTAEAIRSFCEIVGQGGGARIPEAALILSSVGPEEAAFLTGRVILSAAAEGKKLTATAIAVADAILDHAQMERLRRVRADVFKGVVRRVQSHGIRSAKMRRKIQNVMIEHGVDHEVPLATRIRTGVKAIELFCDATGLFVIESQGHRTKYVRPTEAVHRWLEQQHARCELLEPICLPMIIPPRRWSSPAKGGYVTKIPGNRLVKQANGAYHDQLRDQVMPAVYDAVNAIQETAWKINTPVLAVMREIWDGGGVLGDLPARQPYPIPPRPADYADNEDAANRWKREASDIHDLNAKNVSKRLAISQRLWVAQKFAAEDAIYFPHSLDFRGRVYPLATGGPHPQGDDVAKALLTFARGEPITHAGAHWLAVHLAGLFGIDKVPFNERVDWVISHEHLILDSADDPLDGQRFWATADSPFMALAACIEWAGYVREGEGFISHLPVSLDGSNSGLQHFSALLRDPIGAKAVNLTPSERPQDIYTDVANAVQAKVNDSYDPAATAWKGNKVSRKIIAFVRYVWKFVLGLPKPTRIQEDIARYLETGPSRRAIEALRGIGKSFITCSYSVWRLWLDPQKTVLIVSAGESGAADNANLIKSIIFHQAGDGLWDELRPRRDQRSSTLAFDVGPALSDKQPSVKCLGITGQLAGNRADIIIADDVENQRNSATEDQRDKLRHATSEFGKIIKPLDTSEIIYLGTPQTEESIYNDLPKRGYDVRIWPARYPLRSKLANYGDSLAPMLRADIEKCGTLCEPTGLSLLGGAPTDPDRFTDAKLLESEMDGTAAEFMLQMMLDTSLSDAERFPLKTSDLIVMNVDKLRAPVAVAYASSDDKQIKDPMLPNVGFTGDRFYGPFNVSEHWAEYTGSVMHIDPAGTGADETAYVVTKFLNGKVFVTAWGGIAGDGGSPETHAKLAAIAADHEVRSVIVEDNFSDGMFRRLLTPVVLAKHTTKWRCGVDGVKVHGMKEKRIIGALEPVMKQHRLVIDREVLKLDLAMHDRVKSGVFQMTHMTAQRGALKHDDRIDVLALAVDYWKQHMAVDAAQAEAEHRKKLDREFEKRFFEGTAISPLLNKGRRRGAGRRMI